MQNGFSPVTSATFWRTWAFIWGHNFLFSPPMRSRMAPSPAQSMNPNWIIILTNKLLMVLQISNRAASWKFFCWHGARLERWHLGEVDELCKKSIWWVFHISACDKPFMLKQMTMANHNKLERMAMMAQMPTHPPRKIWWSRYPFTKILGGRWSLAKVTTLCRNQSLSFVHMSRPLIVSPSVSFSFLHINWLSFRTIYEQQCSGGAMDHPFHGCKLWIHLFRVPPRGAIVAGSF